MGRIPTRPVSSGLTIEPRAVGLISPAAASVTILSADRALGRLGATFGNIGERARRADEKVAYHGAIADADNKWTEEFITAQKEAPERPAGMARDLKAAYDQDIEAAVQAAPERIQDQLRERLTVKSNGYYTRATAFEHTALVKSDVRMVDALSETFGETVAADPGKFDESMTQFRAALADMDTELLAGDLADLREDGEKKLAYAAINGLAMDSPREALAAVQDGAFDEFLDVDETQKAEKALREQVDIDDRRIKAEAKAMQTRKDVLGYIRATGGYSQAAQSELERLQTEADFSKEEVAGEYATFLSQERDRAVSESGLSDSGKASLFEAIEEQRFKFGAAAGKISSASQRQMINDALGSDIQALTGQATMRPGDTTSLFRDLDAKIEELAPGLTPEEETAYRDLGRRDIALNAIDGYLTQGNYKSARDIIETSPGIIGTLPPGDQRRVMGAIRDAEQADISAAREAQDKLNSAELIKGGPLTLSERLRLAGVAGTGGGSLASKVSDVESVLGRPMTTTEKNKLAGVGADPLTDTGKLIQDREMFVNQYGAESEQVQAFDDASRTSKDAPKLSDVAGVRKEFTALSGEFVKTRDSFSRIAATAKDPSPAGDLALMFNYMKMLDPGSVVRESEFAQVAATGSLGDRFVAGAQKLLVGERLSDAQRHDFVARAEDLMRNSARHQLRLEQQFSAIADKEGLGADLVVVDFLGPYRDVVGDSSGGRKSSGSGLSDQPKDEPLADTEKKVIRIDLNGNVIK